MKRHKMELAVLSVFLIGLVFLFWGYLQSIFSFLPLSLIILCVLFVVILLFPYELVKKNNKNHEHEAFFPIYFLKMSLSVIVSLAIIIMAVVLFSRPNLSKQFDVTKDKVNSLSEQSLEFLKTLKKDVMIYCVPAQNDPKYCQNMVDLVSLYQKNSPHISKFKIFDFQDQNDIQLAQPSAYGRVIVLTVDEGTKQILRQEMAGELTENNLTNTLIGLIKEKKIVYFLSGHGEPVLTKQKVEERSYDDFVLKLQEKSYRSVELDLNKQDLPSDAQVIVAGDNLLPYDSSIDVRLTEFVKKGGHLLLSVNPYRPQNLPKLYDSLGLKLLDSLLVLNQKTTVGQQIAKQFPSNPPTLMTFADRSSLLTQTLSSKYGASGLFPLKTARPILILDQGTQSYSRQALFSAYSAAAITLSSSQLTKLDPKQPLYATQANKQNEGDKAWNLAVSVKLNPADKNSGEVNVFSFSFVDRYIQNDEVFTEIFKDIFQFSISSFYQDKEFISIPAKNFKPKSFDLSRNPLAWLPFFAFILPLSTALVGLLVWLKRRKA